MLKFYLPNEDIDHDESVLSHLKLYKTMSNESNCYGATLPLLIWKVRHMEGERIVLTYWDVLKKR